MRQSYLKNAALMTGADILLRLAGMGLRIWLANALGGEGMGLYQLVLAVYSLFVTLATAGVSVAATRLMAEELARSPAEARGMLHRLLLAGAGLGVLALAAQFGLAGLAAKWWLGDVRAAGALRVSSLGLPWMAVSSVLRGFFIARRQVEPNVLSQLAEQTVRIGIVYFALERADALGWDVGGRCTAVLGATAVSEAVSTGLMALFYRKEARRCFGARPACRPQEPGKRLWDILWPVEGGRCLASALHTAENMLVPACLAVYLQFSGGRAEAVAQYGSLKGMALPLLTFPFGLLGSLSVLLMPEITQAHLRGQSGRLVALIDRMLRLTGLFLGAGRRSVLGVGSAAGRSPLRQRRGGQLPCHSRPGHAADVPREHGGWCHEGGRRTESRLPVQHVGLLSPHCGRAAPAAPLRDEGLSFCDIAVQLLHLHRQHGAAAVQLRPSAASVAVAGRTELCGGRQRRGRAGPAASFGGLAHRRSPLAAGGGSAGRRGDGSGLLCSGVAAGPRRRAAGRGGRGEAA